MNKKAQIYILAAIILSIIVFSLSSVVNKIEQKRLENDFEKLSKNYAMESANLINNLISNDQDVSSAFLNFTVLFTSYSKAQNPNFELIYALDNNTAIQIGNFLSQNIIVNSGTLANPNLHFLDGCYETVSAIIKFDGLSLGTDVDVEDIGECQLNIPAINNIYFYINGSWYPFAITPGKPQIMIVSQLEEEEQKQVYVGGEGFTKEGNIGTDVNRCESYRNQRSCVSKGCTWTGGKCI
jgi:hypothetical protein